MDYFRQDPANSEHSLLAVEVFGVINQRTLQTSRTQYNMTISHSKNNGCQTIPLRQMQFSKLMLHVDPMSSSFQKYGYLIGPEYPLAYINWKPFLKSERHRKPVWQIMTFIMIFLRTMNLGLQTNVSIHQWNCL